MKNLIRIAPRLLWIVSVAYILLYLFLFIEIDAIFPKADILGELLYNLALSIIAANLFYLFIDYFPREARKLKLLTHLDIHIGVINSQIDYILKYLNCPKSVKALSINERDFQSIKECFEKIPMNFVVPNKENVRGQVMRILEYINDKCLRIVEETKDLQLAKEVYSAELYILLLKIKNARFHKYIKLQLNYCENSNSLETTDAKLERFFDDFINLILDIQALNEEWEKHRVKRQKVHH